MSDSTSTSFCSTCNDSTSEDSCCRSESLNDSDFDWIGESCDTHGNLIYMKPFYEAEHTSFSDKSSERISTDLNENVMFSTDRLVNIFCNNCGADLLL